MNKSTFDHKDVIFFAIYAFIAFIGLMSTIFEPQYGDMLLACLVIVALSVIPNYAIVKGYVK